MTGLHNDVLFAFNRLTPRDTYLRKRCVNRYQ